MEPDFDYPLKNISLKEGVMGAKIKVASLLSEDELDGFRGYARAKREGREPTDFEVAGNRAYFKIRRQIVRNGKDYLHGLNRSCKWVNEDNSQCAKSIRRDNKSGYCREHFKKSPEQKSYRKNFEATPERVLARKKYAASKKGRETRRKWDLTDKGVRSAMLHRNAGDIRICLEECNRDTNGDPLCFYTNVVVRDDGQYGAGRGVAEHIDPELKGTKEDGPHNWVLADIGVNSSKNNRCLFEWHSAEKGRLNLRPIEDILEDMMRLGKRIPNPRST